MANTKYTSKDQKNPKHLKRRVLLPTAGLIIIIAVIAGLELSNTTHWFHSAPQPAAQRTSSNSSQQTTSNKAGQNQPRSNSVAKDTTAGATNSSGSGSDSNKRIGNARDTGGQASSGTSKSQWAVSESGKITVKQPAANSTLHSGDVLSGSASTNYVHFRLQDNNVGVIARGKLKVDGGNFSGTLHFHTSGSHGRLDVFSKAPNGRELNEVQIPVKY